MRRSLSKSNKSLSFNTPRQSLKSSPTVQKTKQQQSISPLKASVSALDENQLSTIRSNRQKLCHTLQTYTLLIRSKNPIRCLTHNSNLSIYCQTEQKLLCANCIFGRTQHKNHRVTPIDKGFPKIEKDLEVMTRIIDREIKVMSNTSNQLLTSLIDQQNNTHELLTKLIEQYDQAHRLLEDCFLRSKSKILKAIDTIRAKHQTLILQLKFLSESYNIANIIRPSNQETDKKVEKKDDTILYEHVICNAISSQKKFDPSFWLTNRQQIKHIGQEETKKIATILELLNHFESKEKDLPKAK